MVKQDWFTENKIDSYTNKIVSLALEIVKIAYRNKKEYFIGGGLAIDFSLGRITRNHHDLDFHPMLKDAKWWIKWFVDKGYKITAPADPKFSETYKVIDNNREEIVDIWPLKLDAGMLLIRMDGKYVDSGRRWEETRITNYKGINIRIENPERVLEQKTRHSKENKQIRKQDQHDFKLLGKSLTLEI